MTIAHLRPLAEEDLVERTRFDRDQGGDELGERFFDTAIASLRALERMPSIGDRLPRTRPGPVRRDSSGRDRRSRAV